MPLHHPASSEPPHLDLPSTPTSYPDILIPPVVADHQARVAAPAGVADHADFLVTTAIADDPLGPAIPRGALSNYPHILPFPSVASDPNLLDFPYPNDIHPNLLPSQTFHQELQGPLELPPSLSLTQSPDPNAHIPSFLDPFMGPPDLDLSHLDQNMDLARITQDLDLLRSQPSSRRPPHHPSSHRSTNAHDNDLYSFPFAYDPTTEILPTPFSLGLLHPQTALSPDQLNLVPNLGPSAFDFEEPPLLGDFFPSNTDDLNLLPIILPQILTLAFDSANTVTSTNAGNSSESDAPASPTIAAPNGLAPRSPSPVPPGATAPPSHPLQHSGNRTDNRSPEHSRQSEYDNGGIEVCPDVLHALQHGLHHLQRGSREEQADGEGHEDEGDEGDDEDDEYETSPFMGGANAELWESPFLDGPPIPLPLVAPGSSDDGSDEDGSDDNDEWLALLHMQLALEDEEEAGDCYMCYEPTTLQPCACKGSVAFCCHMCCCRWLAQKRDGRCSICRRQYGPETLMRIWRMLLRGHAAAAQQRQRWQQQSQQLQLPQLVLRMNRPPSSGGGNNSNDASSSGSSNTSHGSSVQQQQQQQLRSGASLSSPGAGVQRLSLNRANSSSPSPFLPFVSTIHGPLFPHASPLAQTANQQGGGEVVPTVLQSALVPLMQPVLPPTTHSALIPPSQPTLLPPGHPTLAPPAQPTLLPSTQAPLSPPVRPLLPLPRPLAAVLQRLRQWVRWVRNKGAGSSSWKLSG